MNMTTNIFKLITVAILAFPGVGCVTGNRVLADTLTETLYTLPFKDARIPVAVIDTGIDFTNSKVTPYLCNSGHVDFTGEGLYDYKGHGTNVAWQIIKSFNSKKYCILVIKYFPRSQFDFNNLKYELKGLEYAISLKSALINFSGGGKSFSEEEKDLISKALKMGTKVVVAAGNHSTDLDKGCNFYPACLYKNKKNFHVVGALNKNNVKLSYSNYGSVITDWERGEDVAGPRGDYLTGTSQATAIISGKLLK